MDYRLVLSRIDRKGTITSRTTHKQSDSEDYCGDSGEDARFVFD